MTRRPISIETLCDAGPRAPWRLRLLRWLRESYERQRQRQALDELDDHLLRDIGLTRSQAQCEARKPFWKP